MKNRAFTLIELLVVVLIIGILASIALPQYQVAVEKSRFSTLKFKTKALAEAVNRYQLANGEVPNDYNDLDISLPDISSYNTYASGNWEIYFKKGGYCWYAHEHQYILCSDNYKISLIYNINPLKPLWCAYKEVDKTGEKVCSQEATFHWCESGACYYKYN